MATSRSRRSLILVAILALSLITLLPSLRLGFWLDDYIYVATLEDTLPGKSPDERLFVLVDGEPERTAALARLGVLPWWTLDELQFAFMRPLSALLLRIDHALFGRSALGYHVHSLVWWMAALLAAALLYRRALPGSLGTLALLLVAVDESRLLPAAWVANRNALVASVPVFWGLWAHLRWRQEGWRPGRHLSVLLVGVGLLGGEMALAALAYVLAYELTRSQSTIVERARALAPTVFLVIIYLIAYRSLGYGTFGSGVYLDPLRRPAAFLEAAITRAPTLLSGGILGLSSDLWLFAPAMRPLLVAAGVAGVGLIAVCLAVRWKSLPIEHRRALRWLITGAGLALLPVLATFPSDRLMLIPTLGIAAGVATVLAEAWRSWRARRRWGLVAAGALLAFIHLGSVPTLMLINQTLVIRQNQVTTELARSVELAPVAAGEVHTVILMAPDHVVGIYLPLVALYEGRPQPDSCHLLSMAPFDHEIRVTGPRTVEIEVIGGTMLKSMFELLYRSPEFPLRVGDVVDRGLFRAAILEGAPGRPERVAFEFDRELTDPNLRFMAWVDGQLVPVALPAAGDSLILRRTTGPVGI